jgi:hypothetical protein
LPGDLHNFLSASSAFSAVEMLSGRPALFAVAQKKIGGPDRGPPLKQAYS